MRLSRILARSVMLLVVAACQSAFAVPVLPAVGVYNQVDASLGGRIVYGNGNDLYESSAGGGASNAFGSVSVSSVLAPAPLPSLTASGTFSTGTSAQVDVSSELDYFFAISGPGNSVLVTVTASGHTSKTNQSGNISFAHVGSGLTINPANSSFGSGNVVALSSGIHFGLGLPTIDQTDSFDSSNSYLFATDTVYRVRLVGVLTTAAMGPGTISVATFVDPVLTINQPGYTLSLSAGAGNGIAPVPEPGSASTLALGLVIFSVAARVRRQRRFSPSPTPAAPATQ